MLGKVNQAADHIISHKSIWLNRSETPAIVETRRLKNLKNRAAIIAMIVWKALSFDWSFGFLFTPASPGPGRIKTQRTERLQKEMPRKLTLKRKKGRTKNVKMYNSLNNIHWYPKQSSQTHTMLIFLILTPPLCLILM